MCNLYKSIKKKKTPMIPLFIDNYGYYFHIFALSLFSCISLYIGKIVLFSQLYSDFLYLIYYYYYYYYYLPFKYVWVRHCDKCFILFQLLISITSGGKYYYLSQLCRWEKLDVQGRKLAQAT